MYKSRPILLNHSVPYKQITAPQQADKIHSPTVREANALKRVTQRKSASG